MPATASAADDSLARYLEQVGRHPILSRSEEMRLGRLSICGDEPAKRRLVESNLRLVVAIARRYRGLGLDLLDLIQEGNLGLMAAVERYDWRRDVRFATYADWSIRRGICRALSTRSRLIRLPLRVAESAELRRTQLGPISLSEPVADEEIPLEERLSDDAQVDPALVISDGEDGTSLRSAASALAGRTRRILELRYGLDGRRPRTFSEVADELGVSRTRAQHLEANALRQLAARPELRSLRQAA